MGAAPRLLGCCLPSGRCGGGNGADPFASPLDVVPGHRRGLHGLASAAYLAYPAAVEDVTEEVICATGGVPPEAAIVDEFVRIVVEAPGPRTSGVPVTVSGPDWFEGLAEVEIDLVVCGSRHFGQRLYIAADAGID